MAVNDKSLLMGDIFEPTPIDVWKKRDEWIDKEIQLAEVGNYLVSDHSTALFFDMRRAYCAGAWISVVIMSISVMDSHFRETESGDDKIGTARLLQEFYHDKEIEWLRKLRNKYVHMNLDAPFLEMNSWFNNQKELEEAATKAMLITIKGFFLNPGT